MMKLGCKIGWALSLVLAIGLGGMVYTLIIAGSTVKLADGRTAVLLLPDERNRVLAEMRLLLESVRDITLAAVEGDMEAISATATVVGMAATRNESPQLIGKLPIEFKTLGFATHQAFDDLALSATVTDDPLAILEELGTIMNNCTGCHESYRLGIEGEATDM
jgi:hypothetical protein